MNPQYLNHEFAALSFVGQEFLVGSMLGDFSVDDDQNLVHVAQMGQAVSDKNPGLVLQKSLGSDDLFEDVLANMGVDSREPEVSQKNSNYAHHFFWWSENQTYGSSRR